jgi:DnaK suppressor protein
VPNLPITPDQIADLKRLLDQRLLLLSKQVDKDLHSDSANEFSVTTPNDADWVAADQIADNQIARVERDTHELSAVEVALKRINNRTYGGCIDCGAVIDYARLLAHPTATRCLACQRRRESKSENTN